MEYEPILLLISLSVQSFLISCSIENQSKNVIGIVEQKLAINNFN